MSKKQWWNVALTFVLVAIFADLAFEHRSEPLMFYTGLSGVVVFVGQLLYGLVKRKPLNHEK